MNVALGFCDQSTKRMLPSDYLYPIVGVSRSNKAYTVHARASFPKDVEVYGLKHCLCSPQSDIRRRTLKEDNVPHCGRHSSLESISQNI
jgi:hypothetical protein